ncbi:dentin sialophosphoprotein-related [Euphorbia peplus]|nr:dentin sialophosphoprotein-related [Euphorbia peplus]
MSFEVPYDQIRQLQISLRKEAGLESYKDDSQLPDLPSFEDSISQLYPSPQYLRCKHCKATLIRGINSVVCVFCGRQQNNDVPPDPIKLTSTSGYRWFLHSLDLDGSELVGPLIEVSQSNQGQITPEVDLPLSDLLDLEIRWPSEPKRSEFTSVSEREQVYKLSNVNVAGVDLDNFFTEAKADNVSVSTDEHITRNKHEDGTETNAFQGRESLSLFENVKPSETVAITEEAISGDSISGWEANFQSAGFGTLQENKLSDPFVGSSSVDLSSHMDAVFGSGKDLFDEKREGTISSISNKNDWFEDPWNNSNSENRDYQFEVPPSNKDQEVIGKTIDSSSSNADWIQGDQWMTGNSGSAATDNRIIDEEDDSIDEWNDFTSSANANVPFSNSLKDVNPIVSSVDQASEVNLLGGSSISKNVDFGSFPELDFFSTTMNKPNSSMETNSMSPESFAPDKMISMTGGIAEEVDVSGNLLNGSVESEVTGIERLMSQMHDLSFMLESNLSVPQKRDPENIDTVSSFSEN